MTDQLQDQFRREIDRQPAAMRQAAERTLAMQADIVRECADHPAPAVVYAGMGTSLSTGWAAASALARRGALAGSLPASELLHARWPGIPNGARVVAVSQSGESAETVKLCQLLRAKRPDVRILAVTNHADSSIADAAHLTISTELGLERGPSTMTYAATMVVQDALASLIAVRDQGSAELGSDFAARVDRAADEVARLLAAGAGTDSIVNDWAGREDRLIVVGRGAALTAAMVSCLILKEAALFSSEALESGDFRHGPLELARPGLLVGVVSLEGDTRALDQALVEDLRTTGTSVLAIGAPAGTFAAATHLPLADLDPLLATIPATVPFQLLAWQRARDLGRTPDAMTVATKVTSRE